MTPKIAASARARPLARGSGAARGCTTGSGGAAVGLVCSDVTEELPGCQGAGGDGGGGGGEGGEGGEGGGFKNPSPVSTMVLLPLIRSRTDLPIIAAGGMCDGLSMAGAFAMGAEGVQMGTRMLSCADSPVHDNWKQAVVAAKETGTVFLNQQSRPALRALRTERTTMLEPMGAFNVMEHMAKIPDLYFGGDMEAAIPLSGQVAGRIDEVKSAADIVQDTIGEFYQVVSRLADSYNN